MSLLAFAAPPAAAPIGLSGALILLLCVWMALYGLKYGYDYSLGALLRRLADSTRDIRWIGGKIAATFEGIDHFVQARIANGIDSVEVAVAGVWDGLAWVVRETGDALVGFGRDVYGALEGIVDGEIPQQISGRVKPLRDDLAAFRRTLRHALDEEMARFRRGIDSVRRDLALERLRALRGIDSVRLDLRAQLRALEGRAALRAQQLVGALRRPLNVRLSRLEAALGAGIIGAVALGALTRAFPWWQCTNVRRFNRLLCRAPLGAIDDLFGLLLAFTTTLGVVEFAEILQEVTEPFAEVVVDVVSDA